VGIRFYLGFGLVTNKAPAIWAGLNIINSKRRRSFALAVYHAFMNCRFHYRFLAALRQIPIEGIPIALVYDEMTPPIFCPAFLGLIHAKRAFLTVTDGRQTRGRDA
jgi:hypothetical protein